MKTIGFGFLALILCGATVAFAQQTPQVAGVTNEPLPVLVSVTCTEDALARIHNERENGQSAMDRKLALLLQSGDCNVN